jgi:hypothetical protein
MIKLVVKNFNDILNIVPIIIEIYGWGGVVEVEPSTVSSLGRHSTT